MRRRITIIIAAVLGLGLAWWLWPQPEVVVEVREARKERPVVARAVPRPRPTVAAAMDTDVPGEVVDPYAGWVACALPADAVGADLRGLRWSVPGRSAKVRVTIDGEVLRLDPLDPAVGAYEGVVAFHGIGEAKLWLNGDSCTMGDVEPYAYVSGLVRASEGIADDRVVVQGCGGWSRTDRDGGFYMEVRPEPCTLRAVRRDGMFTLRSDPVDVDPRGGADVVLDLDMPPYRASGVGTSVAEHEHGILLRGVFEGSVAEAAGLKAGDVVVAVDGWDTVDLEVWQFVDVALGPPGSEVTYTVLRDGEETDIVMRREPMEARW